MNAPFRPCGDFYREPIEDASFDPFYITDEELARRRAAEVEAPLRRARIAARRAAGTWGVVVRDHGNGRSTVTA